MSYMSGKHVLANTDCFLLWPNGVGGRINCNVCGPEIPTGISEELRGLGWQPCGDRNQQLQRHRPPLIPSLQGSISSCRAIIISHANSKPTSSNSFSSASASVGNEAVAFPVTRWCRRCRVRWPQIRPIPTDHQVCTFTSCAPLKTWALGTGLSINYCLVMHFELVAMELYHALLWFQQWLNARYFLLAPSGLTPNRGILILSKLKILNFA